MLIRVQFCFVILFFGFVCQAQGTKEDYERAEVIKQNMNDKIFYAPEKFYWLEEGNKFWYLNSTPKGKEFILVDVQTKSRKLAFNHIKLAQSLSLKFEKKIEPYNLPFTSFLYTITDKEIEFIIDEKLWRCDLSSYDCIEEGRVATTGESSIYSSCLDEYGNLPVKSPDKKWITYIKNHDVYIRSTKNSAEENQLSYDGAEGEFYSSFIEWAPDSKRLATNKIRLNKPQLVYLIESSPEDQLQPKLHSRNYLKPGAVLPQKQPTLFLIEDKKQISVDHSLISSQYSLSNPKWRKDSRGFTFEYYKRNRQSCEVIEVDVNSGNTRKLIDEESTTFIDIRKKYRYDIDDGKEIIWASERDGWNHLYLYDGKTGKVKTQITKGDWIIRDVVNVDEVNRTIIFEASGREAGQDPYLIQLYKVNFNGTDLKALTTENANHLTYFSPDHSFFVDSYSRIDLPTVTVLRSTADGGILMKLEKAEAKELLSSGWRMPEVFSAKGRDGKTDIWGIIVRPSNFDPNKTYPVIEYIYAGPHSSFVPKSFISNPQSGDYRTWTLLHELAELGFIVVQIDGMGTSNRSKAFHDVCWKNLKDAGFPDRILWIKAAAQKYSYMDLERIGIFGNSAGGQNSVGALLFHPDFYKVAVSSSGCHDNRMDKLSWNEQWMGYPVGPQYIESSNVENAYKFKGQLLLILGEMDRNVPPASTLQLVDALIKANKTFDFLMVPGMGHSLGGDYGEHKRRDFFVEHLLDVPPPVGKPFAIISRTGSEKSRRRRL